MAGPLKIKGRDKFDEFMNVLFPEVNKYQI